MHPEAYCIAGNFRQEFNFVAFVKSGRQAVRQELIFVKRPTWSAFDENQFLTNCLTAALDEIFRWRKFPGIQYSDFLTDQPECSHRVWSRNDGEWCSQMLHYVIAPIQSTVSFFFLCASRFSQFHQELSWQMIPRSSYINSLTSRCQSAWGHLSIQFQFLLKSRGNIRMELSWKMSQGTQFLETDWRWPSLVSYSQTMDYTLSMSAMSLDLIYRRSTWVCSVSWQVSLKCMATAKKMCLKSGVIQKMASNSLLICSLASEDAQFWKATTNPVLWLELYSPRKSSTILCLLQVRKPRQTLNAISDPLSPEPKQ